MESDVIKIRSHARTSSSIGYRSGRSSCLDTPEARSTSKTRKGGTSSHWATACFVICNDAASLVRPPAALMARSRGVFDMISMSSTASQRSQEALHLQRKAPLYAVGMTLGNKIKSARKARKLSLDKLGKQLGVSRQLVWQWERDESDARKHIEQLAQALEVPVEYFYGPTRPDEHLGTKIKRLTPAQQKFIESMVDNLLDQEEDDPGAIVKRA
jgi:transcriptional regulator with XRE-family HTH domain